MTSAEAAALRDLVTSFDSDVPGIDPERLARAYAAIMRRWAKGPVPSGYSGVRPMAHGSADEIGREAETP
jgi:hypothetical protein